MTVLLPNVNFNASPVHTSSPTQICLHHRFLSAIASQIMLMEHDYPRCLAVTCCYVKRQHITTVPASCSAALPPPFALIPQQLLDSGACP
mmetsp:Transcript_73097/g.107264  ORF Transcript_73097/g.107264 Transcript_73097/m.107264 type:complete len:90 (+) Transcript_73097:262-531(+)